MKPAKLLVLNRILSETIMRDGVINFCLYCSRLELTILNPVDVNHHLSQDTGYLPFMGSSIPSKEETKVQVSGMNKTAVILLGNNGSTHGKDLIEHIVENDLSNMNICGFGNTL